MIATTHMNDEELMAFAEGELPRGVGVAAEEHLRECAECAARLSAWRLAVEPLREVLATWANEPVPVRVERVVLGNLAERSGRNAGRQPFTHTGR